MYRSLLPILLSALLCIAPASALADDEADDGWGRELSLGGLGALYAGIGAWSYFAWYQDPPHDFAINDDGWFGRNTYAGGADKLGHLYANALLLRTTSLILEEGGWSRREASLIGAGLTTAAFTAIEIKDGFHYAFSVGDMVANLGGVALALALVNLPELDEALSLRLYYWPSPAYRDKVARTGSVNVAEDYSGQTYALAWHLRSLPALADTPFAYVDALIGFRARHYKPEPIEADARPTQRLFVGVAWNVQAIIDDFVFPGDDDGLGARTSDLALEHLGLPLTHVEVVDVERHGTKGAPD